MDAVNYTTFRKNLRAYLDKVRDDCEPLIVTSADPESNAVVMNQKDYDNLMENMYIMSNDYLMAKIRRGDEQLKKSGLKERELVDD